MFISVSVNAIRRQHMSVSCINSSRSERVWPQSVVRSELVSWFPQTPSRRISRSSALSTASTHSKAGKQDDTGSPESASVCECACVRVRACVCVWVSVRLVRAYWCVQFLCLDDHEIRTVCAYYLFVSLPYVRLPVSSSSKLFQNYSLS